MRREFHPYGHFIPKRANCMIVGSFPIAKFSDPKRRHEIKAHEFDFFFGGEKNLLWKLLGDCYGQRPKTREEVIHLLEKHKIAIGDVIASCKRKEGKASDSALYDIQWNDQLLSVIKRAKIKKLFFTSKQVHRWFKRLFPEAIDLEEIILPSPSAQSARSIARLPEYVAWKKTRPDQKTYDFILEHYKRYFSEP